MTSTVQPDDLVRIAIHSRDLDFTIQLPFMKKHQLTVNLILSEIERVLQSYEEFVLDGTLDIDFFHVKIPAGSGRVTGYVNTKHFLKNKHSILQIKNKDSICCARALVTARARIDEDDRWNSIRQGRKIQEQLALELHDLADVPVQTCGIEEVKQFQIAMPDYQIFVVSKEHLNAIVYSGPEKEKKIFLYYHDSHFDIITSMPAFLSRSYFCSHCLKGYSNKEDHACNNSCFSCHKIHPTSENARQLYCKQCTRYFRGEECFALHLKVTEKGNSTCKQYFRYQECGIKINRRVHSKEHRCGEVYCRNCIDFFSPDHQCYMLPAPHSKDDIERCSSDGHNTGKKNSFDDQEECKIYIYFDFECTQDKMISCEKGYKSDPETQCCVNCKKATCGSYEHEPNLCIAYKVCTYCIDGDITSQSTCEKCGRNERCFSAVDTVNDFCEWLFSRENNGATTFCHNFKGYDSYPILKYLYNNGIIPKVIPNGAKNMAIEVPACKIRMLDSLNFMPTSLSKLPKMFGINELKKGYFPHLFNTKANRNAKLEHHPEVIFYNPDEMKEKERGEFMAWYEENKHKPFDLQFELLQYCRSDVDILRRCCLEFRKMFMQMTSSGDHHPGIDPFESSITIASACNLVFRTMFLDEESIGIIPPHGYRPQQKQSIKAYKWLKYLSETKGIIIQHAFNGGEERLNQFLIDETYEEEDRKKIALEFHGCFWHGCSKCFDRETINPVSGLTMNDLYQQTQDKKKVIEEAGYVYNCIWECDFDKDVANDPNLKAFFEGLGIPTPLEPRDAFYGGRTEAFTLYKEAHDGENIQYYDVTSLYPYINKTGKVPLGHPKIITESFDDITNYEGLIKCKIIAPRHF